MAPSLTTPSGQFLAKPFPLIIENPGGSPIKTRPVNYDLFTRNLIDPANSDNIISQEFSQYSGYELFLRFDYGKITYPETGEEIPWSGEIYFGAPWIVPTWGLYPVEEENSMAKLALNFIEGFRMGKNGEEGGDKQMESGNFTVGAVAIPGVRFRDQISWMQVMLEIYYLDHFYDKIKDKFPDKDIFEGTDLMVNALRGKNVDDKAVASSPLPRFASLIKMCQCMKQRMMTIEPYWVTPKGSGSVVIIEAVVSYVRGRAWGNCGWLPFLGTVDDNYEAYLDVRQNSVAFNLSLEFLYLEQGGLLEHDIRIDPLFKTFVRTMASYAGFVNDALNLGREISEKNYQENLILIMGKMRGKGAGRKTLEDICTTVIPQHLKRARKYDTMLRKKFPNHEMLDKYIYHVYALADCVGPATCFNPRYSKGFEETRNVEIILRPWPQDSPWPKKM